MWVACGFAEPLLRAMALLATNPSAFRAVFRGVCVETGAAGSEVLYIRRYDMKCLPDAVALMTKTFEDLVLPRIAYVRANAFFFVFLLKKARKKLRWAQILDNIAF